MIPISTAIAATMKGSRLGVRQEVEVYLDEAEHLVDEIDRQEV
jgi:hypothetical protein